MYQNTRRRNKFEGTPLVTKNSNHLNLTVRGDNQAEYLHHVQVRRAVLWLIVNFGVQSSLSLF